MNTADEEYLNDDTEPTESILRESCPIPYEDYLKEFEESLMDLDLRF